MSRGVCGRPARGISLAPHQMALEVPYPFARANDFGFPVKLEARDDLGLEVVVVDLDGHVSSWTSGPTAPATGELPVQRGNRRP